jgi:hypothetical protein
MKRQLRICRSLRGLIAQVFAMLLFCGHSSALASPADAIKTTLATFCETDSIEALDGYKKFQGQLARFQYNDVELATAESMLRQVFSKCTLASKEILLIGLMQQVAENWKHRGDLGRADSTYELAYRSEQSVSNDILGTIAVLQGWAEVSVELKHGDRAMQLAAEQTKIARRAYASHRFDANLLISSLQFNATILEQLRRQGESEAMRAEARRVFVNSRASDGHQESE